MVGSEHPSRSPVMIRLSALAALAALVLIAPTVDAARVPSRRTVIPPSTGARTDVTVPYTTNGRSTLGVAQGVSPFIYGRPALNDPMNHGVIQVYNLPFYGARQATNSNHPGATPTQ